MTRQVTVEEARAHLEELLDAVKHGDEIEIAADGRPLARLTAAKRQSARPRTPDLAG